MIEDISWELKDWTLPSEERFRMIAGTGSAVHRASEVPTEVKEFRIGHSDTKNFLEVTFCL